MTPLIHINTFSQVSPAISSPTPREGGDILAGSPVESGSKTMGKVRNTAAMALLALSLSAGAQDHKVASPADTGKPILLAQADIDTDGKGPYTALVPQVNGGTKIIEYLRDAKGAIKAPPVKDGKLVDGSVAPENPVEARIAQKKILAKYDKIILVSIDKKDLLLKANKEIGILTTLAEQGKLTKEQVFYGLYSIYLVKIGLADEITPKTTEDINKIFNGFETYGRISLKLPSSEIQTMKLGAEKKAKEELQKFNATTA